MERLVMSKKKATSISNGIFLVCLGILILTDLWWPGIILAIWITLASRQYLSGRIFYAGVTSFVLLGLFFASLLKFQWNILAPVLLATAGIFIIIREYYFTEDTNGEEKSLEIKEDSDIER